MFTSDSTKLNSVPIIAYNSNVHFARNVPFSQTRSHIGMFKKKWSVFSDPVTYTCTCNSPLTHACVHAFTSLTLSLYLLPPSLPPPSLPPSSLPPSPPISPSLGIPPPPSHHLRLQPPTTGGPLSSRFRALPHIFARPPVPPWGTPADKQHQLGPFQRRQCSLARRGNWRPLRCPRLPPAPSPGDAI